MFHNFGFEVAELLEIAEQERVELRHPYVGSEHLLLAILKQESDVANKLKVAGLTYSKFRQELIDIMGSSSKVQELILYTPLLKRILELALEDAMENNKGLVTTRHLLLAMLEEGEGIAIRIMISMNIDIDELYDSLKKKKTFKKERDNTCSLLGSPWAATDIEKEPFIVQYGYISNPEEMNSCYDNMRASKSWKNIQVFYDALRSPSKEVSFTNKFIL